MATQTISITAGTINYSLPSDYILDVRDGVRITAPTSAMRRLRRMSLQWWLSRDQTATRTPEAYLNVGSTIKIVPIADAAYTAELSYYQLPAVLGANDVPKFPSDWALVE